MSRNRRRFSPHGRKFNERGVERTDNYWDVSLATDPIETPKGGLEEVDNARSFRTELRGRVGTSVHNRADYEVAPLATETYTNALLAGGTLFIAKGSAPVTGDIFFTTNTGDYSGAELTAAKRAKLNSGVSTSNFASTWGYDFYLIDTAEALPTYIGNLSIPPYKDFYPRETTGGPMIFGIAITNGVIASLTPSVPLWTEDIVGMYIYYGEFDNNPGVFIRKRDLITELINGITLRVSRSDLVANGDYSFCMIQPRIHASYYMQSVDRLYVHAGQDIYEVAIPIMEWKKLNGIVDQKPFTSDSRFHEIKGDLILTNDNGHYRIKVEPASGTSHYWKINTARANKARNTIKFIFGFPTSTSSDGENPYIPAGFSGMLDDESSDKLGGQLLP